MANDRYVTALLAASTGTRRFQAAAAGPFNPGANSFIAWALVSLGGGQQDAPADSGIWGNREAAAGWGIQSFGAASVFVTVETGAGPVFVPAHFSGSVTNGTALGTTVERLMLVHLIQDRLVGVDLLHLAINGQLLGSIATDDVVPAVAGPSVLNWNDGLLPADGGLSVYGCGYREYTADEATAFMPSKGAFVAQHFISCREDLRAESIKTLLSGALAPLATWQHVYSTNDLVRPGVANAAAWQDRGTAAAASLTAMGTGALVLNGIKNPDWFSGAAYPPDPA